MYDDRNKVKDDDKLLWIMEEDGQTLGNTLDDDDKICLNTEMVERIKEKL